jgi:multiple sugar transport system ATP-binding protein
MADKIGIMNDGVLQQYADPDTVYEHPANLFVAQFVGSPIMNVADCACEASDAGLGVRLAGMAEPFVLRDAALRTRCLDAGPASFADGLALGVRPEAVSLKLAPETGLLAARVQLIEPLGAYDIVDIAVGDASLRARTPSRFVRTQGEAVWVGLDAARTHLFDKRSGRSLRQAA